MSLKISLMTYSKSEIDRISKNFVDSTIEMKSRTMSFAPHLLTAFLMIAVIGALFSAPAAAQASDGGGTGDFLCGENSDSGFVSVMQSLLTVLMAGGPVIGTVVAVAATVAASAKAADSGNDYYEVRRKALISGWSVPVIVYALDIMASGILGMDISCIIP